LRPPLPPLRSIPPGPRVFAPRSPVQCLHRTGDLSCPSTPPSASLTFKPRRFPRPRSTPKPGSTAPRLSFFALQHSSDPETHLCIPCGTSERLCSALPDVPPSGFGYPLGGFRPPDPREPLSAPNAPGLPLSKLSSLTAIGKTFPSHLSALALFTETFSASVRRFSGFLPP
jgi:hypothetical protein